MKESTMKPKNRKSSIYKTLAIPKSNMKLSVRKKILKEGQIDSDDIDDSHIILEPKSAILMMTPSYQLKHTLK